MSNPHPHNSKLTDADIKQVREVYETSAIDLIQSQRQCTQYEERIIKLQLKYNKEYQKLQRARENTSLYNLAEKFDVSYNTMRKIIKYEIHPDIV